VGLVDPTTIAETATAPDSLMHRKTVLSLFTCIFDKLYRLLSFLIACPSLLTSAPNNSVVSTRANAN
jgi:hypothetical protein